MNIAGSNTGANSDVASHRLSEATCRDNFGDIHHPLDDRSALVEADRCYYCYDAPCQTACPTDINVPNFIRMIGQKNNLGAAQVILSENIMGGTCARACPVETLCEYACVRNSAEDTPVRIGLLQRYAIEKASDAGARFFQRAESSGCSVAIVGAGPAGLSCAHRLAVLGHEVVIYDAQAKAGGLNEYGLAAYKMAGGYAQREVQAILAIGGISIRHGVEVGEDISFAKLQADHDAVFMGVGLGANRDLKLAGEQAVGVINAVDYIHDLRQAENLAELPVGRRVLVVGGGMTAIDIAVQIKRLGASDVTIAYRRDKRQMNASHEQQEFAQHEGVRILHWAKPVTLQVENDATSGVEFVRNKAVDSGAPGPETNVVLAADMVFKAIGQTFAPIDVGGITLAMDRGRIRVDECQRTSQAGIWAGGDCVAGGDDLTVSAVQDGKTAALSIHSHLTFGKS